MNTKTRIESKRLALLIFMAVLQSACGQQQAESPSGEILVTTQDEYFAAANNAQPGDRIVLANGVWRDFEMLIDANGTESAPITVEAEESGKVIISGRSNLRLAGSHIVIRGLVFRDGHTPTREVIAFRRDKDNLAYNSRVTEVVIDHFNNPERFETDFWVMMYGQNNRFDHNHLVGKSNVGVTMAVRLDSEESQNNAHRIDHNYFGPREILGSNGGETFRIGTSKYSLTTSNTLVENNYFDRCNGEVEIVSNKSGGNVFRGNLFFESQGTLTLRHGNDNLIEGNVFLGNNVEHTGGFRVINKRQTVRNNYLAGLTGHRFGGGLVVMNGVPNSPINRYHQVEDSVVENNTIIDARHIELAAGADAERSAPPITTTFRNNLIVNTELRDSIAVHDDISGITFTDNVASNVAELPASEGFTVAEISLAEAGNGLLYPTNLGDQTAGVTADIAVLDRNKTGVPWYPKPGYGDRFNTGATHNIAPGEDAIINAVAAAEAGDIIVLAAGDYQVSKIVVFDKPLTIRGASSDERPRIFFERSALFELADGASLQLSGLTISGELSPDAYGNSVVRTSKYSMLTGYELIVEDCEILDLNTNHSFDFLQVSMSTFANRISIRNTSFSGVTGHVFSLAREIDDLGRYNVEYLDIVDSTFTDVGKSVANIYRGGTDESTFGPHLRVTNSEFRNIGHDKRNKTNGSIYLLGVQATAIEGNTFADSKPIVVEHTVGDPVTLIASNLFSDTPVPVVSDDTATIRDNQVEDAR